MPPEGAPPRFPGIRGPDDEYDAAFDRADRATAVVARGLAVGVPVWLVLLLVIPFALDTGAITSLLLATLLAVVAVVAVERLLIRPALRRRRHADGFDGVARAGRAFCIGLITWALVLAAFAQADMNPWAATFASLALAVVAVEAVERLVVRPIRRRRTAGG
jgi:hypothetical protein